MIITLRKYEEVIMDFGKIFGFIFKDNDWIKKVLIGGLLYLIPVVGACFPIGYFLSHYKNMKEGRDLPLPEWDEIGEKFMIGLKMLVVYLVYTLPLILLWLLTFLASFLFLARGKNETLGGILIAVFYLLILLYYLLLGIILPAIVMMFAENFQISDGFKLGEIFGLVKSNLKEFLMLFLILIASSIFASLGIILCGIGVIFTSFIAFGIYLRAVAEVNSQLKA